MEEAGKADVSGKPLGVFGPEQIQKILAHYGPEFIWVDRVEIYDNAAVGYLNVTAERCRGHFNASLGYPLILPEIFFAEFAGQTGAVWTLAQAPRASGEIYLPVFAGEKRARLSSSALVGDIVVMKVFHIQKKPPRVRAEGILNSGEEVIFWMEFGYRLLPERFWKKFVRRALDKSEAGSARGL